MIPNGIANDGETADRKAFLAGMDIDMESNLYREYLLVKSARSVKRGSMNRCAVGTKLGLVSRMEDRQQKSMADVCCAIPI
jgi:hypothetical protein